MTALQKATYGAAGFGALFLCAATRQADAQTAQAPVHPPAATRNGGSQTIEEVVVTARRRNEALRNVPATIEALSAHDLRQQNIHTEADLQIATPGLVVQAGNNGSMENFVIRGESVDAYSGSPPGVQPYVNDVPQSGVNATEFYDLQSVQVLKGPQGTLFGRNATGGAVLYQTQQPTNGYGGYVSVQYGNLDRLITEGAVNLPIVPDKVLLRIAATGTSGGAYIKNLYNGQMLGDQVEQSVRATLEVRPNEDFTNTTTFQYSNYDGTDAPDVIYYTAPCGEPGGKYTCVDSPSVPAFLRLISGTSGVLPGYPAGYVYPGGLASLQQYLQKFGPYTVDQDSDFSHNGDSIFLINKSSYKLSDDITLNNIFGYSYHKIFWQYDDAYSPYPTGDSSTGSPPYEIDDTTQYSDEFQVQGKALDDRLTYLAGFFWIKNQQSYYSPIGGIAIVPPDTLVPYSVAYSAYTGDTSYAIYSQMTYKLTDKLNLTLGGRGTWEDLNILQLPQSVFGPGHPQSTSESNPSWTASLDYHIDHDLMVYLTTRGSWRRGGFNAFASPGPTTLSTAASGGNYFLPETVKDVEIGAKYAGRIAGVPTQFNVDLYNSWIDNLQKTAYVVIDGNAASASVNVPSSQVSGIEGSLNVAPTDWLRLGGSFSYTNGRFTDPTAILFGTPATFGPFGDVPRFSGSVYGQTVNDLPGNAGILTYRAELYAQSSYYFSNLGNTLTPGTKLPGYGLINMRLDWSDIFGLNLTGSLWVKNLTDHTYYTGGTAGVQDWSVEAATLGLPRTYGFTLRYEF